MRTDGAPQLQRRVKIDKGEEKWERANEPTSVFPICLHGTLSCDSRGPGCHASRVRNPMGPVAFQDRVCHSRVGGLCGYRGCPDLFCQRHSHLANYLTPGVLISIFGLVIGVLVFAIPWYYWRTAQRLPAIHDLTTDTENPPRFVSISPLRKNAPNSSEYGGPELAAKQRAGYPDLAPAMLSVPLDKAFE